MPRTTKAAVVQITSKLDTSTTCAAHRRAMTGARIPYIEQAGKAGVRMLCFQEIFPGPYFCPSQDRKWCPAAEGIRDRPTTQLMSECARKCNMVIIAPVYEERMTGLSHNAAAAIDADRSCLGRCRKDRIPEIAGIRERFFFGPDNPGCPIFDKLH